MNKRECKGNPGNFSRLEVNEDGKLIYSSSEKYCTTFVNYCPWCGMEFKDDDRAQMTDDEAMQKVLMIMRTLNERTYRLLPDGDPKIEYRQDVESRISILMEHYKRKA